MEDLVAVTTNVIKHNYHMVIASADADGKPWVSPVFYMYDDDYNLYWVSDKAALHSKNIRSNPRVAICIFGPSSPEDGDRIHGVYIDAEAVELHAKADVARAAKIMQQRPQADKFMIKSLSDVTGGAAWRIYKATPRKISKRADGVDEASGQVISVRESVTL